LIPSAPVVRAAIKLLRVTPVPVARALAAVGGNIAWALQGNRRRMLAENLSRTASDRSERERRRMVRRTFQNMAVTSVDQFRMPSSTPAEVQALFEIRGLEHVDAALARGKGVVIATAHLGPYELAAACLASKGYKVAGMVENLAPELLDALTAYRSATGMEIVNMKDGLRAAYRVLGQNYVLCLVADRAIGEARSAIEVPFAGGVRAVPIGPAVFAQATGAALITAFASPHPAGSPRYLMEFDAPLYAEGRDEAERQRLMSIVVERMVAAIRRNPDAWFVFQPNWITREPA
jgi:KDO2-lipid IV(A) lauroyltransferase